ncbi:MAG: hypothetical protein IE937_12265 [Gammaproteobacteria bacterium]|nr:hypothetical protein [Thioclava sp.]MBD3756370.1 hypothetical protein [Gammaproteobacteria bacterium]MBD3804406.1 hypothetical protein [Thioclava sp.]
MWKWVFRIGLIALLGFVGIGVYDYYRAGLNTRPEMPPGAFSLSFKSGLRAVMVDVPDERDTRRYFGFPQEVPFYLEDAWAICTPPTDEEKPDVTKFMEMRDFPGERFEVVCRVQVDDDTVIRGIITTVPKV